MSTDEVDYQIVNSGSELGEPMELRRDLVVAEDWLLKNGKVFAAYAYQMTGLDYDNWQASGWVELNGMRYYESKGEQYRYLATALRNSDGRPLWPTIEEGARILAQRDRPTLVKLIRAVDQVNTVKQPAVSAEGKALEESSEDPSPTKSDGNSEKQKSA